MLARALAVNSSRLCKCCGRLQQKLKQLLSAQDAVLDHFNMADHATAGDDATRMLPRARSVTLAVNFSVTAYSTVITAATKLLNCVKLPGTATSETYLFVQGSVKCDFAGWQVCV